MRETKNSASPLPSCKIDLVMSAPLTGKHGRALAIPKEVGFVPAGTSARQRRLADHSNGALVVGFRTDSVPYANGITRILKCDTEANLTTWVIVLLNALVFHRRKT